MTLDEELKKLSTWKRRKNNREEEMPASGKEGRWWTTVISKKLRWREKCIAPCWSEASNLLAKIGIGVSPLPPLVPQHLIKTSNHLKLFWKHERI